MDRLAAIAGHGGSLTGGLTGIESYGDVSGLSIEGASSWSVDYIDSQYRVPGLGSRALRVEVPPGGTVYLSYTLPSQLVDVVAGSRVDASAKVLALDGGVEASISILYSPGGGGCSSLTLYSGSGIDLGRLVLAGRGLRLVDLQQVSKITVSDSSGLSRVNELSLYSLEVPPGRMAAYTPGGIAFISEDRVRPVDTGYMERILAPGGFMYPLFSGDRLTISSSRGGDYLVVKLVDPWGRVAPLESLSLKGYPMVKGRVTVSIDGYSYTIGPVLPLDGLYLFPLDNSGEDLEVTISNEGAHPVAVDYIGFLDAGSVRHVDLEDLERVPLETSTGVLGAVVGKGRSIELELGDYRGLLLIRYDIEVLEAPDIGVASSPETVIGPGLDGWAGISTGVVTLDSGVSSVGLLITLSSREGATVMVDRITMGYMATLVIGTGYFEDPDDTWCPVGAGANCMDDYVADVDYTYILAFKVVEVHESSNIWSSYLMVSSAGYGVLAEGYASNPDDPPAEPDDPIVGVAIGFNATSTGSGTSNQVIYYPQSIYSSNDKNVTGYPEPSVTNSNSDYSYLNLVASGAGLLLGGVSIVVSGPMGTALAVASLTTGYYSLIFGISDHTAPTSQHNQYYDVYILRDYDRVDGVSNATLGLMVGIEFSTYYDEEKRLQIYYYMPPGPTYPSENLVSLIIIIHNTT
ncbi:MAG: hypothetical protein GSR86_02055 [Desulfurococcales archaeon]|nr:hypothetical protein [Desulfurococcales archaeon]